MYLGGDGMTGVTSVAPDRPHLLEIRRSGAMWEEIAPSWVALSSAPVQTNPTLYDVLGRRFTFGLKLTM